MAAHFATFTKNHLIVPRRPLLCDSSEVRGWLNATPVGSASCGDLDFALPCTEGGGGRRTKAWPVT